ncbi:hypothetical protein F4861DRAFT_545624 [Xylaria intraflava]|nr:hypothetical protein F4861DRAFT_545624 [Xylaria intraflava]
MSDNGRRVSQRNRFPSSQQQTPVLPRVVKKDGPEDDDDPAQKLNKSYDTPRKSPRTANSSAARVYKKDYNDDHNSNDRDSAIVARSRTSGQRIASASSIPQPTMPNTPSKPGTMTVEKAYPGMFLPPTRENILMISNDRNMRVDSVSFPWKKNAFEVDKDQFNRMKVIVTREVSKQFVAFSTSKCVGWAIKTRFPWLDCSTELFRALRYQGYHHAAALKHDFLYEKLYTYLLGIYEEFPGITNLSDNEVLSFLGARFNKDLAVNLWGRSIRVLDIEETFAEENADKLGPWYMRQVYLNMSVRLLPVIISEVPSNPTLKWNKKSPTGWSADKARREEVSWFFDCLCIAPEVSEVEFDAFQWLPDEDTMPAPQGARASAKVAVPAARGIDKHRVSKLKAKRGMRRSG